MATVEERMKILKMIEDGKISAEDGAKLLAALNESRRQPGPGAQGAAGEARWLRVRVTDLASGKTKVNVNLPIGLVNVGLKLGARFAPGMDSGQMEAIAEALRSGALGKVVEVSDEEDGERVEIYVE